MHGECFTYTFYLSLTTFSFEVPPPSKQAHTSVQYVHKWMVKAPHCVELAWKLLFSTWRYRVLTVCDRSRLNSATLVPEAIHTAQKDDQNTSITRMTKIQVLKGWPNIQVLKGWPNLQVLQGWPNIQVLKGWPKHTSITVRNALKVIFYHHVWKCDFKKKYTNTMRNSRDKHIHPYILAWFFTQVKKQTTKQY